MRPRSQVVHPGVVLAFQLGSRALRPRLPVADRAPLLHIELRALLGGSAPRREFRSGRTDGDIPGADFLCGRCAAHAIRGRLRQRRDPHEQHEGENLKRSHCCTLPSLAILHG